ncbi:hypothetical protein CYY_009155 [Polysphondylium violaceum]|uniref:DUF155 domain-containing protein n=1 Tax=Polysphondylium violaceum TaxID=133409 RepID=A0A8J4PMH6_9MYCE|nr:hypothetical protein CYY_009155 [Polysphondylium violaceum]
MNSLFRFVKPNNNKIGLLFSNRAILSTTTTPPTSFLFKKSYSSSTTITNKEKQEKQENNNNHNNNNNHKNEKEINLIKNSYNSGGYITRHKLKKQQREKSKDDIELCKVICTARSYSKDISNLPDGFIMRQVFMPSKALWIKHKESDEDAFIFPSHGVVVSWGLPNLNEVLQWLKAYENEPLKIHQTDTYKYITSEANRFEITKRDELLNLSQNQEERDIEKFSISYAFAQSVGLFFIEDYITQLGDNADKIHLAPKADMLKQLREQMRIKSFLNLRSDIIDTPEHFWEHPEGEGIYRFVRQHCEIDKRVRILNEKLNLINEIYEIYNLELKHDHSSFLEKIIIFLIALEIIINVAWIHPSLN